MSKINYYKSNLNLKQVIQQFNLQDMTEAVYICDLSTVVNKFKLWQKYMPNIRPYYAVKCNDDLMVVKTLLELGAGFDCASQAEIQMVLDAGAKPEQIIFAHPCKPEASLKYAKQQNVLMTTVDNECELYKIKKNYRQSNLVLRFRSEAKASKWPLGKKFGCEPHKESSALLMLAKSLDLKIKGMSFHVGCECLEIEAYGRAIATAKDIHDTSRFLGDEMEFLDIGGGYPGSNDELFKEIAKQVNKAVAEYFVDDSLKVIAEPGRFFVESAFTLVCKIQAKREVRDNAGKLDTIMYYINDGVYGSFIYLLMEHEPVKVMHFLDDSSNLTMFKSTIWGPTCDSTDKISDNLYLPNLNPGDLIAFHNMGAYTLPLASKFNGIPIPKTMYFQCQTN